MSVFSLVRSRALHGATAVAVRVEVHLANGLPGFSIVGLPDAEVRESRERVRAALQNSGFQFPSQRITVNLAPADLPKGSGRFDLPIAIGIAAASGQLPNAQLDGWEFSGELSLDGSVLSSPGAFALALSARQAASGGNVPRLMFSLTDAAQAARIPGVCAYGAPTLLDACAHLVGHGKPLAQANAVSSSDERKPLPDMADVRGQAIPRRALTLAAAGGHNLLMLGPPGSGKSMLAQRLPGLMPDLEDDEALEVAALRSLKGLPLQFGQRPFEAPHHSATLAAMVGGGKPPQPGCATMAHHGVLFMDEVLEFDRRCLEALREPLETGAVHLARAGFSAHYPARFQWVVAHNPCPCGWLGHPAQRCNCTPERIQRYRDRLSGPLLDRLDIGVEVSALSPEALLNGQPGVSSDGIRAQVSQARQLQRARQGCLNAFMNITQLDACVHLDQPTQQWLAKACSQLGLTGRSTHRLLRVARTIADLAYVGQTAEQNKADGAQPATMVSTSSDRGDDMSVCRMGSADGRSADVIAPVTEIHLREALQMRRALRPLTAPQPVVSGKVSEEGRARVTFD